MQELRQAILIYWSRLRLREQRLLMITLGIVFIGLFYWGGVQPLQQKSERAKMQLASEKQLLDWVKNEADIITALRKTSSSSNVSSMPLNQLLSTSSGQYNIELVRLQPRDDMVQVWIKPVSFNSLIQWLIYLRQKKGVDVAFLEVNKTDESGIVEVNRLQFEKIGG